MHTRARLVLLLCLLACCGCGKKKSTDNLNVIYNSPKPRIIHSAATQDPDAGLVDLAYGTARFVVQYD